jgi:DNA repair exonuclease SbcCD ATPase subunit
MTTDVAVVVEVLEPEIVGKQLAKVETESGLGTDEALALRGQFAEYYNTITEWRGKAATVKDPENPAHQKIAREVRLGLKNVRCDVERVRKAMKADALARGKAIDGFANVLKYLCEPVEEQLAAVEQHAERKEQARVAALAAERLAMLAAEGADGAAYNLGVMDDATWALVLAGAKQARADREAAARQAEADRVAREQADRIAREKAEADAAAARAEAEKERKARAAAEAEAKAEREAADAKARAEKANAEAKLKAEREAREKLEREAAEAKRKEAERIATEKRIAAEKAAAEAEAKRKAAAAPDREKLATLAAAVRALPIPELTSEAGATLAVTISNQRERFAAWIETQAAAL